MSKKLLGAVILSSLVFLGAPFTSLAQETPVVIKTEVALDGAQTLLERAAALRDAATGRIKEEWVKQFGIDVRIQGLKDANKQLREKLVLMNDQLVAKNVTDAVQYAQVQSCMTTVGTWINNQGEE